MSFTVTIICCPSVFFGFFLPTVSKPSSLELPLVHSFNLYQISLGVLILDQACKMCFKFSNNFNYTPLIMGQWGFLSALIAAQVGRAWLLYACAAFTAVWLCMHKSFAAPCATNSVTLMWKTSFHVFHQRRRLRFPTLNSFIHNHVNGDASLNTAVTCQSLNKMKLLKCQQSY